MDMTYTSMLANLNVGSAHPGGLSATKSAWRKIKHFPLKTILDAGCGTGQTLKYLSDVTDCRLIGVDHHSHMIQQAKKRLENKEVELILADLNSLPLADESVDCVFSESVSSFSKIDRLLGEFNRVLRPDGLLCLIEITSHEVLSEEERVNLNQFYGTEQILTKAEWYDQIHSKGFDILDTITLPATTAGEVNLDLNSDSDQLYLNFLTHHFKTIDELKEKLVGIQILSQKKSSDEIKNDCRTD